MKNLTHLKEQGILSIKKGFTLVEILIVMMVVGVLAIIAVPSYNTMFNAGTANSALNNLVAIYNAEVSYGINNNHTYCTNVVAPLCNNLNNINANLSLNIPDPGNNNNDGYFTYVCSNAGGFQCTATNLGGTVTIVLKNAPIVLQNGAGCATTSAAGCNPRCTAGGNNCPS